MKNKGFTLVELVIVIALMALISTIVIVNMTGVQTDNIELDIKRFKEKVAAAGCNYIDMGKELVLSNSKNCSSSSIKSRDDCKNNGGCYICAKTIIKEGLIDRNLLNPNSNKKLIEEKESIFVYVYWKNNNGYKEKVCEYRE